MNPLKTIPGPILRKAPSYNPQTNKNSALIERCFLSNLMRGIDHHAAIRIASAAFGKNIAAIGQRHMHNTALIRIHRRQRNFLVFQRRFIGGGNRQLAQVILFLFEIPVNIKFNKNRLTESFARHHPREMPDRPQSLAAGADHCFRVIGIDIYLDNAVFRAGNGNFGGIIDFFYQALHNFFDFFGIDFLFIHIFDQA